MDDYLSAFPVGGAHLDGAVEDCGTPLVTKCKTNGRHYCRYGGLECPGLAWSAPLNLVVQLVHGLGKKPGIPEFPYCSITAAGKQEITSFNGPMSLEQFTQLVADHPGAMFHEFKIRSFLVISQHEVMTEQHNEAFVDQSRITTFRSKHYLAFKVHGPSVYSRSPSLPHRASGGGYVCPRLERSWYEGMVDGTDGGGGYVAICSGRCMTCLILTSTGVRNPPVSSGGDKIEPRGLLHELATEGPTGRPETSIAPTTE
ncbi:hypothetical protein PG994_013482 [Apiospora phragmitis]|uniref:Uncharacterized protein n=1 Tax=Apiospora phragmitis TaxID=2905665 RepID=A0ABR1T8S8_9PEZI